MPQSFIGDLAESFHFPANRVYARFGAQLVPRDVNNLLYAKLVQLFALLK